MAARRRDLIPMALSIALAAFCMPTVARSHCVPDTLTMSCMPSSHVHVFNPTSIDPDTIPADDWTLRRLDPSRVLLASMQASTASSANETVTYELTPERSGQRAGVLIRNLRYAKPGLRLGFPGDGWKDGAAIDILSSLARGKPGRVRLTAAAQPAMLLSLSAWDVSAGRVLVEARMRGATRNVRELSVGTNLMFLDHAPSRVYVEETPTETRWVLGFAQATTGWVRPGCGAGSSIELDEVHVSAKRSLPLAPFGATHDAFGFVAHGLPRVHMRVADRTRN